MSSINESKPEQYSEFAIKEEKAYTEALDYLYSQLPMFSRTGAPAYKPGLQTSLDLDLTFGSPHKKFRSIHIAGTNGKGSTSHMIASTLQEAGFKTALYTSPHLVDFRERIRINGKMIPEEKVVEFVNNWKNCDYKGHPSFFELTMIMAFDWFASENVDFAVIETGMGGRLDSTNIIHPEMCVITNISKDHTQFLGETLPAIAAEKAGIIKDEIPVVIGENQGKDISQVFIDKASEKNSPLIFADDPAFDGVWLEESEGGWKVNFDEMEFIVPLGGDYQKKNIRTAIVSLLELRKTGISISGKALKDGLENVIKNTGLRGRWSLIAENPLTIADTGHNIAGMAFNMKQLRKIVNETGKEKLRIVIGFVADKAIDEIMDILPLEAEYYLTKARIPRALPVAELKKKFDENGFISRSFPDVSSAYSQALSESSPDDVLFIGGSTFIVADFFSSQPNPTL